MTHFSDEEMNLICIFDTSCKSTLIADMQDALFYMEDDELKSITQTILSKFQAMTDLEFSAIEFIPPFGGDEVE